MVVQRPGFGLPLDAYTVLDDDKPGGKDAQMYFPSAVSHFSSNTPTVRERGMLWLINHVTDKPQWWDKVHDQEIVGKWKKEVAELVAVQQGIQRKMDADYETRMGEGEAAAQIEGDGEGEDEGEDGGDGEDDGEGNGSDLPTVQVDDAAPATDNEDNVDNEDNDNETDTNENDNEDNDEDDEDEDDENEDDEDDHHEGDDEEEEDDGSLGDDSDFDLGPDDELEEFRMAQYLQRRDRAAEVLPLSKGFSDAMFDFCIKELREKAELYKKTGIVGALDGASGIFKSDTAVSTEVRDALRAAVKPLEDVPEDEKDWHPGSDGRVLDLVHPSLWPLVYGKTRVLSDRELTLDSCMDAYGSGETIPVPEYKVKRYYPRLFSTKFQWLPAEVDVDVRGRAKIVSYINNLVPSQHADLYGVVEKVIDAALPLWSAVYSQTMSWAAVINDPSSEPKYEDANARLARSRIHCVRTDRVCGTPEICKDGEDGCSKENRPGRLTDEEIERRVQDDDADEDDLYDEMNEEDDKWYSETHAVVQPEPIDYKFVGFKDYKSSGPWFAPYTDTSRIQVIVKLANIELTPEKPSYDGGSWHLEGQLNEKICATALYYYDNKNVTDSHLAFRTSTNAEEFAMTFEYDQNEHSEFTEVYGVTDPGDGAAVIPLGDVNTREGRLLVFPNVFQHQVQSFELADKTRPGHRKILALFLVDPLTPVISTANVPPQQKHWGNLGKVDSRLPPELSCMVYDNLQCPYGLHEAKELRLELMEERKALDEKTDKRLHEPTFSLCEH